jgi:vacuolar-type H+-ATPase subunit H
MEVEMANGQPGPSDRDAEKSTDELLQTAKSEARALKEQARETAAEMKAGAREAAGEMKQQVLSTAASQKNAAAQQIDGWAHALKTASEDLDSHGQRSAAEWVRQAAAGLERASGNVRERDVSELIGTVEDFARRQPVAFIGGAVAAGFGLARLLKSSAGRDRGMATGSRMGEGSGMAAGNRYGEGTGTVTGSRMGEGAEL